MESGAAQAVSSVALRSEGDRIARKKDEEVWRSSETGVQLRKVEFERKLVKKDGQEGAVKLLPTEESKGEGSGVVMTVTAGEESEDVDEGMLVFVMEDSNVDIDNASEDVDVGSADPDTELVDSKRSCLRSRCSKGAGLVSTCISPLISNSLKCAESSARGATRTSYADAEETITTSSVNTDIVIESRSIGRLLPGRGLSDEEFIAMVPVFSTVRLWLPSALMVLNCLPDPLPERLCPIVLSQAPRRNVACWSEL